MKCKALSYYIRQIIKRKITFIKERPWGIILFKNLKSFKQIKKLTSK